MARPPVSDWETVFGFTEDPTPGDPDILEQLATEYRSVSDDADSAFSVVSRLDSQDLGEGKSMEKLREKLAELPDQVGRLRSSYEAAADAVQDYATRLREGQKQADGALEEGRAAKVRLVAATAVAVQAGAMVAGLDGADPPPPDDEEARSAARRAMVDAKQAEADAARPVEAAEADLAAARLLAVDAQELLGSDATLARRKLEDAEGEAVEGKSIWDKFLNLIGTIFGVLSAVLGIIAFFIPGLQGLGLALTIGSVLTGLVPLGINIARGIDTGKWDIPGLVLGFVGLGFGAFALAPKAIQTSLKVFGGKVGTSVGSAFKGIPAKFRPSTGSTSAQNAIPLRPYPNTPPTLPPISAGAGELDDVLNVGRNFSDEVFEALPGMRPSTTPPGSPAPSVPAPSATPPGSPAVSVPGPAARSALASYVGSLSKVGGVGTAFAVAGLIYGPVAFTGHAPHNTVTA